MMFLNCQKPGLIKDPYIYKPDSIMLDLEDAVAENQKDAARYSLYHALQEIDYRGVERVVRINGLDTPHWKEDIRVCVAGGADTIRIASCLCPGLLVLCPAVRHRESAWQPRSAPAWWAWHIFWMSRALVCISATMTSCWQP